MSEFTRDDVQKVRGRAAELREAARRTGPEAHLSLEDAHYSLALGYEEEAIEWEALAERLEGAISRQPSPPEGWR